MVMSHETFGLLVLPRLKEDLEKSMEIILKYLAVESLQRNITYIYEVDVDTEVFLRMVNLSDIFVQTEVDFKRSNLLISFPCFLALLSETRHLFSTRHVDVRCPPRVSQGVGRVRRETNAYVLPDARKNPDVLGR
jgi:hypothetical protein